MPELSPWDLAGLTAKLGFYIGLICCMGSVAAPLLVVVPLLLLAPPLQL